MALPPVRSVDMQLGSIGISHMYVSYFHLGFVHHKDTKIRFLVSLKKITVDVIVEQILNFIFVTIMLRKTRLLSGYCVGLQVEGSLQDHFQCCVFPNTWSMGC